MQKSQIKTSVIVCTRNRGASAVATIESILANRFGSFELLLIDQSSNDETKTAVLPFMADPRFRYIPTQTVGAGRARNLGLQEARAEICLLTDDDCTVPADWIAHISQIFHTDPQISMVFCNVDAAPHDESAGFVPVYEIHRDYVATKPIHKIRARGIGAGMAVRRKSVLSLGGFDELLGPGGRFSANEEGDLALRILLAGMKVYETHQVAVQHDGFRTWEQGKALAKRNWLGIGAAYVKPLKKGHWQTLPMILYEGIYFPAKLLTLSVWNGRKPQGLKSFIYFWKGFWQGAWTHVDSRTLRFVIPPEAAQPDQTATTTAVSTRPTEPQP